MTASGERAPLTSATGSSRPNFSQKCGSKLSDQPGLPSASTAFRAERRAMKSRMNRLSQACGGARRKRAMIASSEGLHAVLARRRAGRSGIALVLRREEGRIDHHRRGEFVAEIMREPDRDAPAERVPDDNRRPGLVCARRARRFPRLADELAEIISGAPIRTPHAAERRRDDAPLAGEERGDEAPPVGVGGPAVQENETRLAALAPGEGLDLRALDGDERPLGLDRDHALEPRRRRRLLPAKSRERRHGVRVRPRERSLTFRRLRTVRPRPCRRRRTSSPRHSARRAACPRSARGRSAARRSCRKGGRPRSRRRRR